MHDFRVSLRLWMMVFRVSRVKQNIWKSFRSMKQELESFWLRLKKWLYKVKKRNDEMSIGYRRIDTYFTPQNNLPIDMVSIICSTVTKFISHVL